MSGSYLEFCRNLRRVPGLNFVTSGGDTSVNYFPTAHFVYNVLIFLMGIGTIYKRDYY